MTQDWQKQLPEAQGSVVRPRETKIVYRSRTFKSPRSLAAYQVVVDASWGDTPKNGSNCFYSHIRIVIADTNTESSQGYYPDDAPARIRKEADAVYAKLDKWHGCHTFGPWYYIENTVYMASERDSSSLLLGERRQIVNGRTKQLAWHRVAIDADGNEVELHKLDKYADGDTPPIETMTLAWRPWCRVGEGKKRELDAARRSAIWLDATDEQLMADDLTTALKARLPALLVEFRAMIESLGFVW